MTEWTFMSEVKIYVHAPKYSVSNRSEKPSCKHIKQSELAGFELNGGVDLK